MAGRFEGLSDLEWKLFKDIFPEPERRGKGMPHSPYRHIVNTLMYILITGGRWCDVPREQQWASKSSAHRWLKRWYKDGTLALLQERIINIAQEQGLIRWEYGAVDGSFSPWQRWR
jgi:transposase